ncbi:MAG: hypothetical protein JSV92_01695 [archaeon]|nr:MAG: hypothetical protein JSV92_01695 [archaeon]
MVEERVSVDWNGVDLFCVRDFEDRITNVSPSLWNFKKHKDRAFLKYKKSEKGIVLNSYGIRVSGRDSYGKNLQFLKDSKNFLYNLATVLEIHGYMKDKLMKENCKAELTFDAKPRKIDKDIEDNILSKTLENLDGCKSDPTLVVHSNGIYEFSSDFTRIKSYAPISSFITDYENRISKMFVF